MPSCEGSLKIYSSWTWERFSVSWSGLEQSWDIQGQGTRISRRKGCGVWKCFPRVFMMPTSIPRSEKFCLRISFLEYRDWGWCLSKSKNSLIGHECWLSITQGRVMVFKQVSYNANNSLSPCVAYTSPEWCSIKVLSRWFSLHTCHFACLLQGRWYHLHRYLSQVYKGCLATEYVSQSQVDRNSGLCVLSGFSSQGGHLFHKFLWST